ncbi:MAG: hypothetical protein HYR57_03890 [Candidatus Koribacter versatilis]|nr:hypothetical protein [Candidatus Koribacter versatilis]
MSNAVRFLGPLVVAFVAGAAGALIVAIFGPLLFPLSLSGAGASENAVVDLMVICFLVLGACGFVLCRKFIARFDTKEESPARHRFLS